MKSVVYSPILIGGLGNRLFQIASVYGMAKQDGREFTIDAVCANQSHGIDAKDTYAYLVERFHANPKYFPDNTSLVTIVNAFESDLTYSVSEKGLSIEYKKPEFSVPSPFARVLFSGYFQHEKYFAHVSDTIREKFAEPEYVTKTLDAKYGNAYQNKFFIHVRLGDYLHPNHHSFHWIDLRQYYKRAIAHITALVPDAEFVISTEDPHRLGEFYPDLLAYPVEILRESDELLNFYLLSRCTKGGICANSSYSWWAAWLNPNPDKIVILPNKWFTAYSNSLEMKGATMIPVEPQ